jgi:dUTP pyrophosphatase
MDQFEIDIQIADQRLRDWGFPKYGSELAAGLDLLACVSQPVKLKPQERPQLISTGIKLNIGSKNMCAVIVPRSGLAHNKGLVLGNTIGIIDGDYQGICMVSAWNRSSPTDGEEIEINPGDRIAQLLFLEVHHPRIRIVEKFDASSARGGKGFGSTGVRQEPAPKKI